MPFRELSVSGAWEFTPVQHGDARGTFLEWFQADPVSEQLGHRFPLAQANCSISAAGVVRGIHFADVPPSQAKYVTCMRGAAFDIVVDLRVGSPTFARWESVLLDDVDRRAVYLAEGLGHAFCALEDDTTVVYLCSTPYTPGREHGVHPLDEQIAIRWPERDRAGRPLELRLSDKDLAAPTLAEALAAGLLPHADEVEAYVASLAD